MSARYAELDGLRACCVALVLASGFHWLLPFGWSGVQIFYVLSGFLITGILLGERKKTEQAGAFFRRFYFRRTLRIFPLYYGYLLLLQLVALIWPPAIAAWETVRPYALTYTLNFGMVAQKFGIDDAYSHLWTLSVEEQFYLVWPLLLWLLPLAWFKRLIWSLVLAGPLVRYGSSAWFGWSSGQIYLSTFSHLDAFAIGALLAVYQPSSVPAARRLAAISLVVTLALGLLVRASTPGLALRTLGYPEGLAYGGASIWGYSAINLCAVLAIAAALNGQLAWLGHPALAYVGKISYGVYLFQRPIKGLYLVLLEPAVQRIIPWGSAQLLVGYGICAAASVGVAALSYRWLEAPLLAWRDRMSQGDRLLPKGNSVRT